MAWDAKTKRQAWLVAAALMLVLLMIGGIWWLMRDEAAPLPTGSSRKPVAQSTMRRPAAAVGRIKYLNDLNNGNWAVTSGNAFMHVNTPGSYLFLTLAGGLTAQQSKLLSVRNAALKAKDDPKLGLTAEQIEKLEAIRFENYMDRGENIAVMRKVWGEYQDTLGNTAADDISKKAAEKKVTDALAKVAETSLEPTRLSYVQATQTIEATLTPEQIKQLSQQASATTARRTPATRR
jgi:hypothetical protein